MTLDQALHTYALSTIHDCQSCTRDADGRVVSITGLGMYEESLKDFKELLPDYSFEEKRRVVHRHGVWLRVDITPRPPE